MKKSNLLLKAIMLSLFVVFLNSCSDDKETDPEVFQLTVASVHPLRFIDDHYHPYFVKHDGKGEWDTYPYVKNFSFVEGYEYVIKIRKKRVIFEEIVGGSPYEYTLLEEISKVEKDTKDIPVQEGAYRIASESTGDEKMPYYALIDGIWTKIPPIEGFEFEEGYELIVYFDCVYNGNDATQTYTYIYTRSSQKERKDTEGIPSLK